MKTLALAALLILAPNLSAGEKNWDEKKAKKVERIDQKIAALQALKSCVEGASDKSAFKACQDQHKATMSSLKKNKKK